MQYALLGVGMIIICLIAMFIHYAGKHFDDR